MSLSKFFGKTTSPRISSGSFTAHNIYRHVRFPLMSKEVLTKVEQDNKSGDIPVHLISKAWRFHATGESDPKDTATKRRVGTVA